MYTEGMRYEVAVATPVARTFTYSYPDTLLAGMRVRVPFGKRQLRGVVLTEVPAEDTTYEIKEISELDEDQPYYSSTLLTIARFLSAYYVCPLGWVLAQMAPNYRPPLTEKATRATRDDLSTELPTTDKLVELTVGQQRVLQEIRQFKNDKPILFYGVTDAGKTEIYLRLITELLEGDGQALVMVPEISLTAQTAGVFQRRFPDQATVVHSGLTLKKRWQSYEMIRTQQRSILIGPRSSIFAPFANLQLIIVDEEHDNSYKQDNKLCYHGRDIAVMRGNLDCAQVVLGSATPSLESWHNSIIGKYNRVELRQRVHNQDNKAIHLLKKEKVANKNTDLSQAKEDRAGSERLSPAITDRIAKTLATNKQVIVIINRRGFSHFLIDVRNNEVLSCPNCSVSLTLHNNFTILKCHYCDHRLLLAEVVAGQEQNWEICGYGSERIEQILQKHFPTARIARLDSDLTTKTGYLNETLAKFRDFQIDILVGTQMLAKGHDFPRVALLVLLQADQMLSLPDFRAAERTFQLLVQAMGRAGRSDNSSEVVIEVIRDDSPIVATAVAQNYPVFVEQELEFRRQFNYPPFTRMACVEMSSENTDHLRNSAEKIGQQLAKSRDLRVLGPADPPIVKINKRYRKVIYFTANNAKELHNLLLGWLAKLPTMISRDVRLKIDVDPQSTL